MNQTYFSGLLLLTTCYLLRPAVVSAQQTAPVPYALFTGDSVMQFTLTANLRVLQRDRGESPIPHPATLTCLDNEQKPTTLPLTLKVRGNFRRKGTNCQFPPLLMDLPKKKMRNTPFAHQNKLKLVTHCQDDEWVVREYLVYKLYNQLTDLSFRAHLARVTYTDSAGKRPPETHWGVLLEDENDIAKRNGVTLSNTKQTMYYADSLMMATVAIFEYMIGNTDWSVPYLHNIRLYNNGRTASIPVPYDFDHSGIVEATYAKPAEQLGLTSVRERTYRGPGYPSAIFEQVFSRFNQAKPKFYALYQQDSRLSKAYVKRTLKYLDEFYALINKPIPAQRVFGPGTKPEH